MARPFILVPLIIGLFLTGCAHTSDDRRLTVLSTGERAFPPIGLVAFCEQLPEACSLLSEEEESQHASLLPVDTAPAPLATGSLNVVDDSGRLDADSDEVRQHAYRLPPHRAAYSPRFIALTNRSMRELSMVNKIVNNAIEAEEDIDTYGQNDLWAMPLSYPNPDIGARGDCEDYVLEKRRLLIDRGLPLDALSIAVVTHPATGIHAVLIVAGERGDLVLDNLTDRLLSPVESGYRFLFVQSGAELTEWSAAELGYRPSVSGSSLAEMPIEWTPLLGGAS
ncbi:hypothetical protein PB2503_07619 [Parvularcula bermudensis HTCC2503]|uniref:Uncharacterized protein n=1 Tax=Parvularcula bermudensis (strain ATCC BAA-594 / HTCC2503 / KCTC 12087) TaxID=314260 RepID=E0TGG0_PARBH|nr:transglutaminase-like cysteine peptidase [Parvularcula bermudensis]ADM09579.1 hypothetical protein PB2503_07619 [Parvularcula bermudensis HTCC2503]